MHANPMCVLSDRIRSGFGTKIFTPDRIRKLFHKRIGTGWMSTSKFGIKQMNSSSQKQNKREGQAVVFVIYCVI